jgi:hypothetical protein
METGRRRVVGSDRRPGVIRLGNHTYDHVKREGDENQRDISVFDSAGAPLADPGQDTPGRSSPKNIRLGDEALRQRLGIIPGWVSALPADSRMGSRDRPDLQAMLLRMGLPLGSAAKYPAHPLGQAWPSSRPGHDRSDRKGSRAGSAILPTPRDWSRFPMSPVSDVTAFRVGKWRLESFSRGRFQAAVTRGDRSGGRLLFSWRTRRVSR